MELYRGDIGIMEDKVETSIMGYIEGVYWAYMSTAAYVCATSLAWRRNWLNDDGTVDDANRVRLSGCTRKAG